MSNLMHEVNGLFIIPKPSTKLTHLIYLHSCIVAAVDAIYGFELHATA